jgi:hypothetical protein
METGSNLAESSKKGYGSKGAVLLDAKYRCRELLHFSFLFPVFII